MLYFLLFFFFLAEKELDYYMLNIMELLFNHYLIFKKQGRFKIAYYYLLEANRISDELKIANVIIKLSKNLIEICLNFQLIIC